MSTNRIVDVIVRNQYPQPVAAAWHRVLAEPTPAGQVKQVIACTEVVLRLMFAYVLLDYLLGARDPKVDHQILKLQKSQLGSWKQVIQSMLHVIRKRPTEEQFFPEAVDWFFDAKGKLTIAVKGLEELIRDRNDDVHDTPVLGTALDAHAGQFVSQARALLQSLQWLTGYRLLRVQDLRLRRGGRAQHEGKISFYVGQETTPIPSTIRIGCSLFDDAMYVCSPDGTRLLEVTPFIRMEYDEGLNLDAIFLFQNSTRNKMLQYRQDETGAVKTGLISVDDLNLPFDAWLARPDHKQLVTTNTLPDGLQKPGTPDDEHTLIGGRFRGMALLGQGGMGHVHLVQDTFQEDKEFALKVMRREVSGDPTFQQRFQWEARRMMRHRHPHVLRAIESAMLTDGRMYITMPVVSGGDLATALRFERPTNQQIRIWLEQMAHAVHYLHTQEPPVIHRDIKPSNFLIDEQRNLLLSDFGVATDADQARITRTMERVGSDAYMSPEQRNGEQATPASDIYSLGLVFLEFFGAKRGRKRPQIPDDLSPLLTSMTQEDPDGRPDATTVLRFLTGENGSAATAPASEADATRPGQPSTTDTPATQQTSTATSAAGVTPIPPPKSQNIITYGTFCVFGGVLLHRALLLLDLLDVFPSGQALQLVAPYVPLWPMVDWGSIFGPGIFSPVGWKNSQGSPSGVYIFTWLTVSMLALAGPLIAVYALRKTRPTSGLGRRPNTHWIWLWMACFSVADSVAAWMWSRYGTSFHVQGMDTLWRYDAIRASDNLSYLTPHVMLRTIALSVACAAVWLGDGHRLSTGATSDHTHPDRSTS